jgi:hypothetical protein
VEKPFLLLVLIPLLLPCARAAESPQSCTTTREFITTLEYLRDQRDFKIRDDEERKIASKVARGCTGAAERFIQVTDVLSASGLSADDSVRTGLQFASRTKTEVAAFITVFKEAFLAEHLDLDMRSALELSRSLSSGFDGDVTAVSKDFQTLVDFCLGERIGLPRPACAEFAAATTRKGQQWNGGIARPFIRIYEFLTSTDGPHLTTGQALKVAGGLIVAGPDSADNFIVGYKYAASRNGLRLSSIDAIEFARDLTMRRPASKQD